MNHNSGSPAAAPGKERPGLISISHFTDRETKPIYFDLDGPHTLMTHWSLIDRWPIAQPFIARTSMGVQFNVRVWGEHE